MNRLWLLGTAVGVTACVSTNAAVLNPTVEHARTCPDAVVIYTDSSKVGKEYEEVAILSSSGESGMTSEQGMFNSQRKKAAQLGANGLIIGGIDEPKAGTKIVGALLGTGAQRKGRALAIWVPADSAQTRAVCDNKAS